MARAKGAGKKVKGKKAPVRKPARKNAVRKSTAPAQVKAQPKAALTFPCNVIVKKGAERVPVEVKDAEQHAKLVLEFGENSVEVQS